MMIIIASVLIIAWFLLLIYSLCVVSARADGRDV